MTPFMFLGFRVFYQKNFAVLRKGLSHQCRGIFCDRHHSGSGLYDITKGNFLSAIA